MKRIRKLKKGSEPSVLLVDPDVPHQETLAEELRGFGFKVLTSARYEGSESLFTAFGPDAVVIGMSGLDVAPVNLGRRLWQLSKKTIPLFYVMPADCGLRELCFGRGHAIGALAHPARAPELAERIHGLIQLKLGVQRASENGFGERHSFFHDASTGVYSRPYVLSQIAQELRRRERYGGSFSVFNVAIPAYGRLKRRVGRGLAERLLIWSAGVLTEAVRASDVIGRTGEDEFSLLLPDAAMESVPGISARLSSEFERARFRWTEDAMEIRIATGSASFPDVFGSAPQLLEAAAVERRRSEFQRVNVGARLAR